MCFKSVVFFGYSTACGQIVYGDPSVEWLSNPSWEQSRSPDRILARPANSGGTPEEALYPIVIYALPILVYEKDNKNNKEKDNQAKKYPAEQGVGVYFLRSGIGFSAGLLDGWCGLWIHMYLQYIAQNVCLYGFSVHRHRNK